MSTHIYYFNQTKGLVWTTFSWRQGMKNGMKNCGWEEWKEQWLTLIGISSDLATNWGSRLPRSGKVVLFRLKNVTSWMDFVWILHRHLESVTILDAWTKPLIPGLRNQCQVGFCDYDAWLVSIVRTRKSGTCTWNLPQSLKRKFVEIIRY